MIHIPFSRHCPEAALQEFECGFKLSKAEEMVAGYRDLEKDQIEEKPALPVCHRIVGFKIITLLQLYSAKIICT